MKVMNITQLQQNIYEYFKKNVDTRAKVYNRIVEPATIQTAYTLVSHNKGAVTAGVDDVTKFNFTNEDLNDLTTVLRQREYYPEPVRRTAIPKPDGGTRYLGIPTFRDRVAQMSARLIMEPVLEARTQDEVIGFRPNRSTWHGLTWLRHLVNPRYQNGKLRRTFRWIINNDIKGAFDNISRGQVMHTFQKIFQDSKTLSLIMSWMNSKIHFKDEIIDPYGTPQGGVISPLIFNMAVMPLDEWYANNFRRHHNTKKSKVFTQRRRNMKLGNIRYIRYADDFILISSGEFSTLEEITHGKWYEIVKQSIDPSGLEANLDERNLNEVVNNLGLTLASEKAETTHIRKGIDFLGVRTKAHKRKDGRMVVYQTPIPKRLQRMKDKIKLLTQKRNITDGELVSKVNNIARGYALYHRHGNNSSLYTSLNWWIFHKVFRHLEKKHNKGRKQIYNEYIRSIPNPRLKWSSYVKPRVLRLVVRDENKREIPLVDISTIRSQWLRIGDLPIFDTGNPYMGGSKNMPKISMRAGRQIHKYGISYVANKFITLQRDNYACAICTVPTRIEVHHIEHMPKGKVAKEVQEYHNRLDNLITLCKECHENAHHNPIRLKEVALLNRGNVVFDWKQSK